MACVSQSIVRYPLLRCIVSAAQFDGGELCFYENYAELVAQDAAGETTTPLRIDYDALLHFRVVRQQQLMRIELPRWIVRRWAEANSFSSELDADGTLTRDDMNNPCTLIEQLREDDMTHFLQSVAPMVAASRRGRSASRVSTTEPLPLTYCAPNPEAASVAASDATSDGDNINEDGDANDSTENVSSAARQSQITTVSAASPRMSPGALGDFVDPTISDGTKRKKRRVHDGSNSLASMDATNKRYGREQGKEDEDDSLSRCLEALGATVDASAVHLTRGCSTQNNTSAILAGFMSQKRNRSGGGIVCGGGSSPAAMSDTPPAVMIPQTSMPSADPQDSRQLPGRGRPRRRAAATTRRRPPHVGNDDENNGKDTEEENKEKDKNLERGVKRERSPPVAGAEMVVELPAATPPPSSPQSVILDDDILPSGKAASSPTRNVVAPTKQMATTTATTATTAARRQNTEDASVGAGEAYNFADFMTAPEKAAHLPVSPEVKKMLVDLQEMLPQKRRGRGSGDTRARKKSTTKPAVAPAGGKAKRPQPKASGNRRKGGGKDVSKTEATLPLTTTTAGAAGDSATAPATTKQKEVEDKEVSLPPPLLAFEISTMDVKSSSQAEDKTPMETTTLPLSQKSDGPPGADKLQTEPAAAYSLQSTCATPMSDYHLAKERFYHQDRKKNNNMMNTVSECDSSTHKVVAASPSVRTSRRSKAITSNQKKGRQTTPSPLVAPTTLPAASESPQVNPSQLQSWKQYGGYSAVVAESSRTNRWRRVVRHLNSLSLHLTQARECGEELRGLFLMMLEDAEL